MRATVLSVTGGCAACGTSHARPFVSLSAPSLFNTLTLLSCGRYEPAMEATDARVTSQLQEAGYEVRSYSGLLLREPSEIRLDMGSGRWVGHFGTLSPFLKCGPRMYLTIYCVLDHSSRGGLPFETFMGAW